MERELGNTSTNSRKSDGGLLQGISGACSWLPGFLKLGNESSQVQICTLELGRQLELLEVIRSQRGEQGAYRTH